MLCSRYTWCAVWQRLGWSRRERTGPGILGRREADACLDPDGPRPQAVDKDQREEGDGGAAAALDLPGPAAAAHGSRRRGRGGRRAQRGHGYRRVQRAGMWCGGLAGESRRRAAGGVVMGARRQTGDEISVALQVSGCSAAHHVTRDVVEDTARNRRQQWNTGQTGRR